MIMERTVGWFKDAIIYQVHVKTYRDTNGDGIGDFKGLISKLDYIRDLGVNTIWVMPFYPSPLRDDGYDIADVLANWLKNRFDAPARLGRDCDPGRGRRRRLRNPAGILDDRIGRRAGGEQ